MTEITWQDDSWIGCILITNVVFFLRKAVLAHYGYRFDLFDLNFKDWERIQSIADQQPHMTAKRLLHILNWSFIGFFVLGVILALLLRKDIPQQGRVGGMVLVSIVMVIFAMKQMVQRARKRSRCKSKSINFPRCAE